MSMSVKEATKELVNATNVMGCDDYVSQQLLETLSRESSVDLFFALIQESSLALLDKISHTDGRSEASVKLLKEMPKKEGDFIFPKRTIEDFAFGVASSHNTLIQSFFRCVKMVAEQLDSASENKTRKTETGSYQNVMRDTETAALRLTSLLKEYVAPADANAKDVIKYFANNDIYLPFI